jgi:molybdopterin synthase catalytic subunit
MRIKLLFFATLKDIVGAREIDLDVPGGATVGDVLTRLEQSYPRIRAYRTIALTAINQEYTDEAARLAEGDEMAVFPPVSGGATDPPSISRDREFYTIVRNPIDAQRLARNLQRPEDGAVAVFEGVVRNNSKGKKTRHLEYEGYEPMALKKLEEIGLFVRQAWEIDGVAIAHRLGRMEIGETSVAVVVTSAHRRPAFEACHYAIDRLKKIVPIWKKEFFEDGEVWIEGQQ